VTRTVVALFTEMGFDPTATAHRGESRTDLRACPFRALAEQHRVVCTLHLGLLRELVEQATAGTVNATLSPFVQPRLCVVHLATAEGPGAV
jgi:predicted ArsR family transcriptional regulator